MQTSDILKEIPLHVLGLSPIAVLPGFDAKYEPVANNGQTAEFKLSGKENDLQKIEAHNENNIFNKKSASIQEVTPQRRMSFSALRASSSNTKWYQKAESGLTQMPGVRRIMQSHARHVPAPTGARKKMSDRQRAYLRRKMQLDQMGSRKEISLGQLPVVESAKRLAGAGANKAILKVLAVDGAAPAPVRSAARNRLEEGSQRPSMRAPRRALLALTA